MKRLLVVFSLLLLINNSYGISSLNGRAYVGFNLSTASVGTNGKLSYLAKSPEIAQFGVKFMGRYGAISGASIGYKFKDNPFRLEFAMNQHHNKIDKVTFGASEFSGNIVPAGELINLNAQVTAISVMLNTFMDSKISDELIFFTGIGFGRVNVKHDIGTIQVDDYNSYNFDSRKNLPAWALLAGFRQNISHNLAVSLRLRYFVAAKGGYDGFFERGILGAKFANIGRYDSSSMGLSLEYLI